MVENKMNGIFLGTALQNYVSQIRDELTKLGRFDLIDQLPKVYIISQALIGLPENFSFAARPEPGPTLEEREQLEFRDIENIYLKFKDRQICIKLDNFGQISSLYFFGCADVFNDLLQNIGIIGKPFILEPRII